MDNINPPQLPAPPPAAAALAATAVAPGQAGADAIINLAANTVAIEKSSVVKGTRANYLDRLTLLILWLFKNEEYSRFLSDECLIKLNEAKQMDDAVTRGRRISQKFQRLAIKSMLKSLDRLDSSKSPIILEVPGDENISKRPLCYQIIAEFMATKHKIETVDHRMAKEFQKEVLDITGSDPLVENPVIDQNSDENGEVRVMIRQEASTYEGIRSSIAYLYRESGVIMPPEMESSLIYLVFT